MNRVIKCCVWIHFSAFALLEFACATQPSDQCSVTSLSEVDVTCDCEVLDSFKRKRGMNRLQEAFALSNGLPEIVDGMTYRDISESRPKLARGRLERLIGRADYSARLADSSYRFEPGATKLGRRIRDFDVLIYNVGVMYGGLEYDLDGTKRKTDSGMKYWKLLVLVRKGFVVASSVFGDEVPD